MCKKCNVAESGDSCFACRGPECEGGCEKHFGEVKRFNVSDPETGKDWGELHYCQSAAEEDIRRGFTVKHVG